MKARFPAFSVTMLLWLFLLLLALLPIINNSLLIPLRARQQASAIPVNLDTATRQTSDNGLFVASYTSEIQPIAINRLHSWHLTLTTADGQPIQGAKVQVDGGMPAHWHGLPTAPQVIQTSTAGEYRIEGLKFHMTGWWVIELTITLDGKSDFVFFNLALRE